MMGIPIHFRILFMALKLKVFRDIYWLLCSYSLNFSVEKEKNLSSSMSPYQDNEDGQIREKLMIGNKAYFALIILLTSRLLSP